MRRVKCGVAPPRDSRFGYNAGVYRYSHQTGAVTPVVVPFVTPVPGGGTKTFQGASFHPHLNNGGELAFGESCHQKLTLCLDWGWEFSRRTTVEFRALSGRATRRLEVAASTLPTIQDSTIKVT
jgi:hypothetical protein